MSKTRNYSEQTKEVMNRFFTAVDALISAGVLKSYYAYCTANGIDRRHFATQRSDPDKGYFEVSWLIPLVTKYGISSDWLLLGKGAMKKNRAKLSSVCLPQPSASSYLLF